MNVKVETNWYLSASSARDSENSNIVYKDVTVRVKGLPIAYIPYLGMQIQVLIARKVF